MKKFLSVLILSSLALAACGSDQTSGNNNSTNSSGETKFSQVVNKTQIAEEDKIENKTAIAKDLVQVYLTLLTDKSLLEGAALDTYIDENFDIEDKAALKAKAEEFLAQEYETSSTVIAVAQTEKDILKITSKLTFKSAEGNKSSNVYLFGRVSSDGNKIIEINGH